MPAIPSDNIANNHHEQHTIKFEFVSMTTRCVLQLIHTDVNHINQVAQHIYENTKRLEQRYNFFNPNSWLTQAVNQRQHSTVALDDEAWQIFKLIRQLSEQTEQVFDVTVGTLRLPPAVCQANADIDATDKVTSRLKKIETLYQQGLTRKQVSEQLASAMGLSAWSLDDANQHLICHDKLTRFDLGGVVKEYAVDCAMDIAQKADCLGLISFGGDLKVLGKKVNGDSYKVGIKNPFNPSQTCLSVPLYNQALTTSGNYERQDQVGQQQFSHLIGKEVINVAIEPASVTVISPSTLTSGVFSTALMLKPDLPLPSVKACGGVMRVILIDQQAQIHALTNEPNASNQ